MNEFEDVTKLVDMDSIAAQQEGEPVFLHQVSGTGGERSFRVLPIQRIILGRDETSAIFIDEAGVSRHHALIEHQDGVPMLVDLASRNGTFLNGEEVDTSPLQTGDRIQVGSALFMVEVGKGQVGEPEKGGTDPELRLQIAELREKLESIPTGSGEIIVQKTMLAGTLENLGLPSLLQTLEANRNTGSLMINQGKSAGHVYLDKGQPTHAKLDRTRGKKALFRLLALDGGRFELLSPGFAPLHPSLEARLDALLLEGMTEIDEFNEYRKGLPAEDTTLTFADNRTFILDRMPPDLFEVLAAISRHRTVGAVIDHCTLSDLDVCRYLLMLLNEKIIEVGGKLRQPR